MDSIKNQIENHPITKEEAKEQFYRLTEEHGIKHVYDFEDAWEFMQELQRKKDFRQKIQEIEQSGYDNNIWMDEEKLQELNPVKHTFADGVYIREITNPPNQLLVTKIHKKQHPFFLMEGEMSILTENGIKRISAPYYGITEVGTKRLIFSHTKCVFVTVHATDKKTPEEVEEEVIAKDFNDPVITSEDIKLLKGNL